MTAKEFYKDHFGHTSQHVSMDKIFVCMELYAKEYANKRVIEELHKVCDGYMGDDIMSVEYIIQRIKELKQ
tara:strand:+ start:1329 stop:1541 length:213 start_codon:yes stop_codon:yes gene_type:complete